MYKFPNTVKVSILLITICAMTYTNHTFAAGKYVCATVSEFVETESEDCVYFKILIKGKKKKNLARRCVDDLYSNSEKGTARYLEIVRQSLEQKKNIYFLINDSDSPIDILKVENKCR